MVNFQRDVYCLLGLPFDAVDMTAAVQRVRDAAAERTPCFISTPNLNFLIGCRTDSEFRDSVINSDLSIADGMPLVWIARWLGIPIRERVPGSGLFEQLRKETSNPLSVYFFGGLEGVAEAACQRLNAGPSGLVCAGFESPAIESIEEMSSDESIARINKSGADFLVVSLGAKKGQAWIERNRARISVPVISYLGAVLNFAAGRVNRAPAWIQNMGLEWLWRIKEERGLWRRYAFDGLEFLRLLVTRVVPFAWLIYRVKVTRQQLDSAAIDMREEGDDLVMRLRGAWVRENLEPLRICFSRAVRSGKNLRIDLEGVSFVDSSFLGLVLLLYGAQKQNAKRLVCSPVTRNIRRIFEYACTEVLLQARHTATSGTPTASQVRNIVL